MFENTNIVTESGEIASWMNNDKIEPALIGKKCFVYDKDNVSKLVIYIANNILYGNDYLYIFITCPSLNEQKFTQVTENKYSRIMLSTISHDLKSPIMVMQGNINLLGKYVKEEGVNHYHKLESALNEFEYYIYDLIVPFTNI